jgi:hypothetical protein
MIPFCKSSAKIHGKDNKAVGSAVQEVIAEQKTDQVKFPGESDLPAKPYSFCYGSL